MHGGKRRELILLQDSEVGLSVLNVVRIRFLEPHVGCYHTINDEDLSFERYFRQCPKGSLR